MKFLHSLTLHFAAFLLPIAMSAEVLARESTESGSQPLNLPMFRAPQKQEVDGLSMLIMWSAHETGDTRRKLPGVPGPRLLACLLDGVGGESSMSVHSLVWTLVDEATGQRHQYRPQGLNPIPEDVGGTLSIKGQYSPSGSLLQVMQLGVMQGYMKVRCEYQVAGMSKAIKSSWVFLWDEKNEEYWIHKAFLQCDRTAYRLTVGGRDPPLAVAYNCTGLADTRLIESAVVSVYSGHEETRRNQKETIRTAELFSNSTSIGDFFGFAFGGRIHFGWTVGDPSRTNRSATPGAALERALAVPGTSLGLSVVFMLPGRGFVTANYWVRKVRRHFHVTISPETSLLLPTLGGSGPEEVQLDELQDPDHRILPCPFLCISDGRSVCLHRWIGPGDTEPTGDTLTSQPHSQCFHMTEPIQAGEWTCRVQSAEQTVSIAYAVSVRRRPFACEPRIPRRSVAFPPDAQNISCSLCGLSENATLEFGVYESVGAASFREELTKVRRPDGNALLGLKLTDISLTSNGTTFILRCRGVEPDGRTGMDFAAVHILPLPTAKLLDVCLATDVPCKVDCRSPESHRLRSLGVSVSYMFSLYSMSGQQLRVVNESSGVLEDARKAAGVPKGALRTECREFFYAHSHERANQNVSKMESNETDGSDHREQGQLIKVLWHESKGKLANHTHDARRERVWMVVQVLSMASVAVSSLMITVFCVLAVKRVRRHKHYSEYKYDQNSWTPEGGRQGASDKQQQGMDTTRTFTLNPKVIPNFQQMTPKSEQNPKDSSFQMTKDSSFQTTKYSSFQKTLGPNKLQQNPHQMAMNPNEMGPKTLNGTSHKSFQPPQQSEQRTQNALSDQNLEQQRQPSTDGQKHSSDQSPNSGAVQSGLEANVDATSRSTRSAEVSATDGSENRGESSLALDRASTVSEPDDSDKETGSELPRVRNQHSSDHPNRESGHESPRLLNQHSSDHPDRESGHESLRLLNQHSCDHTDRESGHESPRLLNQHSSPAPRGVSPDNSTGVGFDFCLNHGDSEQVSSESQ